MNSYEKIYNILIESTPVARKVGGSRAPGREAAKSIAIARSILSDPEDQEDITKIHIKRAKEKGGQALRFGNLEVRLQDKKQKDLAAKHKEYDRAVK